MRRALALLLFCLVAAPMAQAGPEILRETTPEGFAYKRMALPDAPMQTIQFIWRDASPLTLPGKIALTALAPAMMHEGPKGEKRGEINELLRDLRASFNFGVSGEAATLTLSAPPEHFPAAVEVLQRFLAAPGLPEKRLETLRRARIVGATQGLANPNVIAGQIRLRFLFDRGPYRDLLTVDPALFSSIGVQDIAAWHQRVLARDNLILATAGPMEREAVAAGIGRLVAVLPAQARQLSPPALAFRSFARRIVYEKPDVAQTIILAFAPTTVVSGAERFKSDLALARLGGGSQGRLFRNLREKLGATYGVSAGLDQIALNAFAFTIRTSVAHDKAGAVIEAIGEEYRRWRADGVTEAELQAAKSAQRSSWTETLKQPGSVASMAAYAEVVGLGARTFDSFSAAREAVTREEINSYIRAHFPQWPLGIVIIAPKAEGLGADCVIKTLEEADRCAFP